MCIRDRPKIKDYVKGNWRVVLGGAGNSKLIELFFEEIRNIPGAVTSISDFRSHVDVILESVFQKHVYSAPSDMRDYLEFQLIIAVWTKDDGLSLLETSNAATIACIGGYSCIGWGESHAKKLADEWYQSNYGERSLVLLANYILKQTKKYEPHCGGDTHVVSLSKQGVVRVYSVLQSGDDENFADAFGKVSHWPLFWCGDETTSDQEMSAFLDAYSQLLKALLTLRRVQKQNRDKNDSQYVELVKQLISGMSRQKP